MGAFFFVQVGFMATGNNEIQGILDKVKDTHEEEILLQTQQLYLKIASAQASWYEKSGFTCEGTLRSNAFKNGNIVDMKMFARLKG